MSLRSVILNKLNKDGKTNIKIRLTHKGMTRELATDFYVLPSEWDAKNLKVNSKHSNHEFINFEIKKIILDYEKMLLGKDVSTWHISRVIDFLKENPVVDVDVFEYFSTVADQKTTQNKNNGRLYIETLKKLKEFHSSKSLSFDEITFQFLKRFEQWLTMRGCAVNTRSIELRNLRAVLNHAIDDEITHIYPFRKFRIKTKVESDTEPLSIEQIRKIKDFKTDSLVLQIARDVFMISFYLIGINVSDLYDAVKPQKDRVVYTRNKTKKKYSIQITPELQELVDKYPDITRLLNFHNRYCNIHNFTRSVNKRLKVIGEKIGEPTLILYHARHTWATIAASLEIPKETIAAALGHGSTSVTDVYIKFDNKKIDEANRKVIDHLIKE